MTDLIDPAGILQDATGWVAVLFVVKWMMSRMDRLIDGMQVSIDTFRKFQADAEKYHSEHSESHSLILAKLERIEHQKESV